MSGDRSRIAAELALVTAALDALLEREPPLSPAVGQLVAPWREVAARARDHAFIAPPRPPPDGDPRDLDHIV